MTFSPPCGEQFLIDALAVVTYSQPKRTRVVPKRDLQLCPVRVLKRIAQSHRRHTKNFIPDYRVQISCGAFHLNSQSGDRCAHLAGCEIHPEAPNRCRKIVRFLCRHTEGVLAPHFQNVYIKPIG